MNNLSEDSRDSNGTISLLHTRGSEDSRLGRYTLGRNYFNLNGSRAIRLMREGMTRYVGRMCPLSWNRVLKCMVIICRIMSDGNVMAVVREIYLINSSIFVFSFLKIVMRL